MRLVIRLRGESGSKTEPAELGTELLDVASERITKQVAQAVVDELTSQMRGVVLTGMTISDDERIATAMVEDDGYGGDLRARMSSLQHIARETLQRFEADVSHRQY